jgi:hypothetical protein
LLLIAIKSDTDVKQGAWFNPRRHCVMQTPRKTVVNHSEDFELRAYVFQDSKKVERDLRARWQGMRLDAKF